MEIKLIDWGLSEYFLADKLYHPRVSSRPYKSPELLIGYQHYDFSMDIWSVGCMLAAMVFQKEYFFLGKDNKYQLVEIVNFMGTKDFYEYLNKYEIKLEPEMYVLFKRSQKQPYEAFINQNNKHLVTPEALDLIQKMLVYDHTE